MNPSVTLKHALVTLATGVCLTTVASAQSATGGAERLFNEARAAMDQGSYRVACNKFRESNRLDPAAGTLLNLANCEEKRGRLATAWTLFHEAASKLGPGDSRIDVARERIAALEHRVPRLQLVLAPDAPPATRVRIEGVDVSATNAGSPIPLDPGDHELVISEPGRPDRTLTISLDEGELAGSRVPPPDEPVENIANPYARAPNEHENAGEAPSATKEAGDDRILGLERRTAAYVAGGVGVAGMLVGTFAGIAGLHQESIGDRNCSDETRTCTQKGVDANDSARSLATVSTIGFVVGIMGAGAGTYLYVTAAPEKSPSASSGALGIGWRGSW